MLVSWSLLIEDLCFFFWRCLSIGSFELIRGLVKVCLFLSGVALWVCGLFACAVFLFCGGCLLFCA